MAVSTRDTHRTRHNNTSAIILGTVMVVAILAITYLVFFSDTMPGPAIEVDTGIPVIQTPAGQ